MALSEGGTRRQQERKAYLEAEGTPAQIAQERATEFDYIATLRFDTPEQQLAAEAVSADLLQAGLKDSPRAARRRARAMLGEDGSVTSVRIDQDTKKLIATREIPAGTAVRMRVKEVMSPVVPGYEWADGLQTDFIETRNEASRATSRRIETGGKAHKKSHRRVHITTLQERNLSLKQIAAAQIAEGLGGPADEARPLGIKQLGIKEETERAWEAFDQENAIVAAMTDKDWAKAWGIPTEALKGVTEPVVIVSAADLDGKVKGVKRNPMRRPKAAAVIEVSPKPAVKGVKEAGRALKPDHNTVAPLDVLAREAAQKEAQERAQLIRQLNQSFGAGYAAIDEFPDDQQPDEQKSAEIEIPDAATLCAEDSLAFIESRGATADLEKELAASGLHVVRVSPIAYKAAAKRAEEAAIWGE